MELLESTSDLDLLIAPVGGGGLLCGTLISVRSMTATGAAHAAVYGAEPSAADDTFRSFAAGKRIALSDTPNTIADGLRTSIGLITFPIIRDSSTAILTASETSIVRAMRMMFERMKLVVEPSAAVPLACMLEDPQRFAGKRVGLIISGGNVDLEQLPW